MLSKIAMPIKKLTLTIQIKDNCFQSFVRINFSSTRENVNIFHWIEYYYQCLNKKLIKR